MDPNTTIPFGSGEPTTDAPPNDTGFGVSTDFDIAGSQGDETVDDGLIGEGRAETGLGENGVDGTYGHPTDAIDEDLGGGIGGDVQGDLGGGLSLAPPYARADGISDDMDVDMTDGGDRSTPSIGEL